MAYHHGLSLGALCLLLRLYGYGGFEISLTPVFLGQPSLSVVGWWLFIGVCQAAPSSMMQELYPYQTFKHAWAIKWLNLWSMMCMLHNMYYGSCSNSASHLGFRQVKWSWKRVVMKEVSAQRSVLHGQPFQTCFLLVLWLRNVELVGMYSVLFHCTFCESTSFQWVRNPSEWISKGQQHWKISLSHQTALKTSAHTSPILSKCCCHSQKLRPFATGLLATMTSIEVFRFSWCGMVGAWWSLDWCQHPWGRWIWTSMASSSPWAAKCCVVVWLMREKNPLYW